MLCGTEEQARFHLLASQDDIAAPEPGLVSFLKVFQLLFEQRASSVRSSAN
jgi:hypothetical protein